jgi:hypothetical protein
VQDLSGASEAKRQDAKTASGTRENTDNGARVPRTDAKGNPVRVAKATGHVSNYSEDKVRPYTLPDPLVTASGQLISSAQQWFKTRRPEILKFYREEIYGGVPDGAPRVTWEVAETDAAAREGTAIMKRAAGRLGDKPNGPQMNMTLYLRCRCSSTSPSALARAARLPGRPRRRGRPNQRRRARRRAPADLIPSARYSCAAGATLP